MVRSGDYCHQTGASGTVYSNLPDQALGRSKGGFTTKIHVMCDALGNSLNFILTGGQAADVTQAYTLIEGIRATYALMDRAYDADKLIEQLKKQEIIPVIPPKSNRKLPGNMTSISIKNVILLSVLLAS